MERLSRIATHDGQVVGIKPGTVSVQIEAVSACATCQAHAHCGFAESRNKTLDIPTADWRHYAVGAPVSVGIDESRGLTAVWIAYLLPALLLLAAAVGGSLAGLPEWVVALGSIAVLALYIGALYLRRGRIERRFTLTLSPLPAPSAPADKPTDTLS